MTYRQSQLTCFIGSTWALAGRALNMPDMTTLGLEVTESCAQTFIGSPSGIGPAVWNYRDAQGSWSGSSTLMRHYDDDFYAAHGFNIEAPEYVQGPEVFEAVFTAWRVTGDELWRELQWDMFQSLSRHLDTAAGGSTSVSSPQGVGAQPGAGWAMLDSIDSRSWYSARPPWDDRQASFLYAEVFKYFYLTFASPDYFSLDEWVFNTEAHPFKLRPSTRFSKIQFDAEGAQPFNYTPLLESNRARSRPAALVDAAAEARRRSGPRARPTKTSVPTRRTPTRTRMQPRRQARPSW